MGKKKEKKLVTCSDCAHSTLMQWFSNPVIAYCNTRNEKEVAQARRLCQSYEQTKRPKTIKHYDSYAKDEQH